MALLEPGFGPVVVVVVIFNEDTNITADWYTEGSCYDSIVTALLKRRGRNRFNKEPITWFNLAQPV